MSETKPDKMVTVPRDVHADLVEYSNFTGITMRRIVAAAVAKHIRTDGDFVRRRNGKRRSRASAV